MERSFYACANIYVMCMCVMCTCVMCMCLNVMRVSVCECEKETVCLRVFTAVGRV